MKLCIHANIKYVKIALHSDTRSVSEIKYMNALYMEKIIFGYCLQCNIFVWTRTLLEQY